MMVKAMRRLNRPYIAFGDMVDDAAIFAWRSWRSLRLRGLEPQEIGIWAIADQCVRMVLGGVQFRPVGRGDRCWADSPTTPRNNCEAHDFAPWNTPASHDEGPEAVALEDDFEAWLDTLPERDRGIVMALPGRGERCRGGRAVRPPARGDEGPPSTVGEVPRGMAEPLSGKIPAPCHGVRGFFISGGRSCWSGIITRGVCTWSSSRRARGFTGRARTGMTMLHVPWEGRDVPVFDGAGELIVQLAEAGRYGLRLLRGATGRKRLIRATPTPHTDLRPSHSLTPRSGRRNTTNGPDRRCER